MFCIRALSVYVIFLNRMRICEFAVQRARERERKRESEAHTILTLRPSSISLGAVVCIPLEKLHTAQRTNSPHNSENIRAKGHLWSRKSANSLCVVNRPHYEFQPFQRHTDTHTHSLTRCGSKAKLNSFYDHIVFHFLTQICIPVYHNSRKWSLRLMLSLPFGVLLLLVLLLAMCSL